MSKLVLLAALLHLVRFGGILLRVTYKIAARGE